MQSPNPRAGETDSHGATPSRYRTSLDGRMSMDGLKVLEDPLVVQLVTENELMLMEIEDLRRRLSVRETEIQCLKQQSCTEEVSSIHEIENLMLEHDKKLEALHDKDEKKVALLRPILEALARYQFEMSYYLKEKSIADEDDITRCSESRTSCTKPQSRPVTPPLSTQQQPQSLSEVNARYEQLYHLIASYQATPSFMSSPYDSLVLDALNHIIALSKTMNALVYASAEQMQQSAVGEHSVFSTPPPAGESQKVRSQSLWSALTGR